MPQIVVNPSHLVGSMDDILIARLTDHIAQMVEYASYIQCFYGHTKIVQLCELAIQLDKGESQSADALGTLLEFVKDDTKQESFPGTPELVDTFVDYKLIQMISEIQLYLVLAKKVPDFESETDSFVQFLSFVQAQCKTEYERDQVRGIVASLKEGFNVQT